MDREPEQGVEGRSTDELAGENHVLSEHSFWPILLSAGLMLVGIGILTHMIVALVGGVVGIVALIGWLSEPWTA
ncbi:MAG: cytochrome c oxidase subunit 4 [Chloroflexota bacterium]